MGISKRQVSVWKCSSVRAWMLEERHRGHFLSLFTALGGTLAATAATMLMDKEATWNSSPLPIHYKTPSG